MATKSAPAPEAETEAPKSAADLLIQMQLEKELEAKRNPLAVTDVAEVSDAKNEAGTSIVQRQVFANGTVLENYA